MTDQGVAVEVSGVEHSYGAFRALKSVDLAVRPAEFMTLLGSSGSGKSTLLQAIAGLIEPDCGDITVGGSSVLGLPPERRDMGFVFQNYALFPHLTVARNVAFPLEMRRESRRTIKQRVGEVLELVGLEEFAHRHPAELSGGQQQRVALARAITFHPRVLLLDEPLGALDRQLRQQVGLDLREVQREVGITTIYVTHDQEEAFVLSNRIAVMRDGKILQIDAPDRIYRDPVDLFVAQFVGDLNVLDASVVDAGTVKAAGLVLRMTSASEVRAGTTGTVAIRPEELQVCPSGDGPWGPSFEARVESTIFGGSWIRYGLRIASGAAVHAVSSSTEEMLAEGSTVRVSYDPERVLFFSAS